MNSRGKAAEARQPVTGCRGLPFLRASVLAFENLERRDVDGIEMETLNTGDRASIQRGNHGCLADSGGASYNEYVRHGELLCDRVRFIG